jgi:predicted TIM-barrel fold metal-dependent hydrolase
MNAVRQMDATEPRQCLPPLSPVWRTRDRLPSGSVDTHCHVFAPASTHPFDQARGYTPAVVTIDDYRVVMQAYGIDRAVAVQPSVYGFDNGVLFAALAVMPGTLRGVAVISPDAPEAVFAEAHRLGVRGVRVNPRNPAGLTMRDVPRLAERIAPLGWHIQLQISIDDHADIAALPSAAGLPIVIDHFGFPDLSLGAGGRAFAALVELAASGLCFVKLSAPYRMAGAPERYRLLQPFVERLVEHAADQLLWALDWPHTESYAAVPDDGPLLSLLGDWLPTPDLQRKVLCDNPARLYWAAPRQQSGSTKR